MNEIIERAAQAYAEATGYYVQFHRGLSSPSADKIREGMRAAIEAMCEPTDAILRALASSRATDDEGEFPPVCDLLDFSSENKMRTVLRQMWMDGIDAALKEVGA